MTIPINILQSMISRNKDTIYEKECRLLLIKTMHIDRKNERMCEAYKKFLHNKKKEIKALVAIQKALKKELALLIGMNRLRSAFRNFGKNVEDVS